MKAAIFVLGTLFVGLGVWWKMTRGAWKEAGWSGEYLKALAITVIVAPLCSVVAMYFFGFLMSQVLGMKW